jgi:hypothetical protein
MNRRSILIAGASALILGRGVHAQSATPAASSGERYRIALGPGLVPSTQLVIGAVSNVMAPGTSVTYPEGGSPESLVIEYLLTGGYRATGGADMFVVRADGAQEPVAAGEEVEVLAGDALVIVDNEAEMVVVGGTEETASLLLGFFTTESQGTGDFTVDGDLTSTFLSAGPPSVAPDEGVTVVLLDGTADAAAWPDATLVLPVTTETPPADWTFVVLPGGAEAAPGDAATPVT